MPLGPIDREMFMFERLDRIIMGTPSSYPESGTEGIDRFMVDRVDADLTPSERSLEKRSL